MILLLLLCCAHVLLLLPLPLLLLVLLLPLPANSSPPRYLFKSEKARLELDALGATRHMLPEVDWETLPRAAGGGYDDLDLEKLRPTIIGATLHKPMLVDTDRVEMVGAAGSAAAAAAAAAPTRRPLPVPLPPSPFPTLSYSC